MATWQRGIQLLRARIREALVPLDHFQQRIAEEKPNRVPGTFIYMTGNTKSAPMALLKSYHHNRVLPERIVLMTVRTSTQARVRESQRLTHQELGEGFSSILVMYGFMERPNVPEVLQKHIAQHDIDLSHVTYVLGRETVLATNRPGMAIWRERLFAFMERNALRAPAHFQLPPSQVLEIGALIEI
jgi:KUP system potassium uptake protein